MIICGINSNKSPLQIVYEQIINTCLVTKNDVAYISRPDIEGIIVYYRENFYAKVRLTAYDKKVKVNSFTEAKNKFGNWIQYRKQIYLEDPYVLYDFKSLGLKTLSKLKC